MTSQLNVDTIVDKAGSGGTNVKIGNTSTYVSDGGGATQNTVQSLTKTWANLNGASFGLRDSFNLGSATDRATGRYTFTKTTNMSNVNYSVTYNQNPHNATSGGVTHILGVGEGGNGNHSTSEYQAECGVLNNGSDVDADVFTMVAGDLS